MNLAGNIGECAAEHDLLRPTRERDDRGGGVRAVTPSQQLRHDRVDTVGGQVDHEGGPVGRKRCQVLTLGHCRRQGGDPSQDHRLRDTRRGQFPAQGGGGGGEGGHARDDLVADAEVGKPAALFGHRAVDRRVAGVQPGHVMSRGVGDGDLVDDLIQRQRPGVDDASTRRTQLQ